MRNQIAYSYWATFSFLRKRVVVLCKFARAPGFPAHNHFFWSHTDSWLVTNKLHFLTTHFFLGVHSHKCVQIYIFIVWYVLSECAELDKVAHSVPVLLIPLFPIRVRVTADFPQDGFQRQVALLQPLIKGATCADLRYFFFGQSQDFFASFRISPIFCDITLVHLSPPNSNVSFLPKSHCKAASTIIIQLSGTLHQAIPRKNFGEIHDTQLINLALYRVYRNLITSSHTHNHAQTITHIHVQIHDQSDTRMSYKCDIHPHVSQCHIPSTLTEELGIFCVYHPRANGGSKIH